VVTVALGGVAVVMCSMFFNPLLSTIGDNAQYIVLGKSLLAGKGLSHINAPSEKPDTKYPFMFPLILAAVLAVAPDNFAALKMVSIVACVGAALLYFPVFRRVAGAGVAAGAALLAVLSPDILRHSSQVLAEVPYLCVSFVTLWWVVVGSERWPERRWVPVALALVVVAYYLKAVGATLAGAVFLWLLLRRRWAWALGFLGGFVLLVLPWMIRSQRLGPGGTYVSYLLLRDPYRAHKGMVSLSELVQRIGSNVKIYFTTIVPNALMPFAAVETPGKVLAALWTAVSVLVLAGLIYRLWVRRSVVDLYLLLFLGVCALWPRVWAAVRFIIPVIPLLLFCLLTGLWILLDPLDRRWGAGVRRGILVGVTAVMALGFVLADRVEAAREREYLPDWQSYFAAAEWAKENTPPESVFICRKPYLFFLRSGRRAVGYRFLDDPEEVIAGIDEVGGTYVVVDQFQWTGTSYLYLVPALVSQPERFPVVFVTEQEPMTVVARVLRAGEGKP